MHAQSFGKRRRQTNGKINVAVRQNGQNRRSIFRTINENVRRVVYVSRLRHGFFPNVEAILPDQSWYVNRIVPN